MKKFLCILVVLAITIIGCSCSSEKEGPNVKGVYYVEGTDDTAVVYVVFDYITNGKSATLPERTETDLATLNLDDNIYKASFNAESTDADSGIVSHAFDNYERYMGYSFALGYGTISADTKAVKMILSFPQVNINEIANKKSASMKLGDYEISLTKTAFEEVDSSNNILSAYGNFEKDYQIASFKWRMDYAYCNAAQLSKFDHIPFGDDFDYISEQMKLAFSEGESWGINLTETCESNLTYKGKVEEDFMNDLPSLDLEIVKEAYPEAVQHIDELIENTNQLADEILDSSNSHMGANIATLKGNIRESYSELCKIFDMDMYVVD